MKINSNIMFRTVAFALAFSFAAATPAYAKNEKKEKVERSATSDHGKIFQDWVIECEKSGKGEKCAVSQDQSLENKGRIIKFSVGYIGPNNAPKIIAMLPLGISIQAGAAYMTDRGVQMPLQLQQCVASGCMATAMLTPETLNELRDASEVRVGVVPSGTSQTMLINLSMKGFRAAFDTLK